MRKFLRTLLDSTAILVCFAVVVLMLSDNGQFQRVIDILIAVEAVICVWYLLRICFLFFFRKPEFDWNLLHGNPLRKVICLVITVPFFFTFVISLQKEPVSAKEFVHEKSLFKSDLDNDDAMMKNKQTDPSLLWSIYYLFVDPGNEHMTATARARNWSWIISILGVFMLNGLLVSTIVGWLDSRKEKWLKGEVSYRRFLCYTRHYVVIGGNDMSVGVVRQLLGKDAEKYRLIKTYVLIQSSRDIEGFRREVFSELTEEQQKRIIMYYGSRNSEEDMRELCLCRAEEVYILGEESRTDDIESYHDTMNMECLEIIGRQLKENKAWRRDGKKLLCRVMFEYQTTFSVFQFCGIGRRDGSVIDFKPFNYYEMWAQRVLVNREIDLEKLKEDALKGVYLPLEGCNGIRAEDDDYVHLFVVGMSRMGVALALEAAHIAHYPNFVRKNIRTKITFIDKDVNTEMQYLLGRFKNLFALSHHRYGTADDCGDVLWDAGYTPVGTEYLGGDFLDIEWEFLNGRIEQNAVQGYILDSMRDHARVTIAICFPESNRSHAAALYLDRKIYESEALQQVLVYNRYGDSIINSLHVDEARYPYLNKLKAFGYADDCLNVAWLEQSEKIGKAVGDRYDEIKRRFIQPARERVGEIVPVQSRKLTFKGKSEVACFWSDIYNGNTMWTKLRSIGSDGGELSAEQVGLLADVEHNRWNIEQLLMNFRPLTREEQDSMIAGDLDKDVMKGRMAHLDICSNGRLSELQQVDVAARAYDIGLTTLLPEIYSQLSGDSIC